MNRLRLRLTMVFAILVVSSLAAQAPAWAQAADGWSFLITPQLWISHIPDNGLTAPPASSILGAAPGFFNVDTKHSDGVSPQWGLQAAAQKGRWTLSGAFQYVNFETESNATLTRNDLIACIPIFSCTDVLPKGLSFTKERVNTTRMDVDFAATYFVPDVLTNWLDLSVGGGFKLIYATASRQFEPAVLTFFDLTFSRPPSFQTPFPVVYFVCHKDVAPGFAGSDCVRKTRVKTTDYFYGGTVPISLITHLTRDAKWLFPFSVTPFLGVENRDDQDVAYKLTADGRRIRRLDGTTFAYGGTVDATLRWLINDTLSAYAGMRVQYLKGHEEFLAYGPLMGMSVRFGGK